MFSSKKIVILSNTSWNIYNYRMGLLESLEKSGARITVIAPPDEYSDKIGYSFIPVAMNNHGTNPLEDCRLIVNLYKIYRRIKPDVILHYTIKPNVYGTLAARILGIPVINNIAGLGVMFSRETFYSKIARLLYKTSLRFAHRVFFQNQDDLEYFIRQKLVSREKTDKLPGSGIDTTHFAPMPKTRSRNRFVFLLMSRMIWEKGIDEYVTAAEMISDKYPGVEFQLLGFLDNKNPFAIPSLTVQKWVNSGYVKYLGATNNVRQYIRQADCIVLPSYYREGVPRTLIEAASMAKPIITTDQVGCKDVVDDGVNGFLCRKKDACDLARQMEKMLRLSEVQRNLMGCNGRNKIILEFDEKFVIEKYVRAIARLGILPAPVVSRPEPSNLPEPVRVPDPFMEIITSEPAVAETPLSHSNASARIAL